MYMCNYDCNHYINIYNYMSLVDRSIQDSMYYYL